MNASLALIMIVGTQDPTSFFISTEHLSTFPFKTLNFFRIMRFNQKFKRKILSFPLHISAIISVPLQPPMDTFTAAFLKDKNIVNSSDFPCNENPSSMIQKFNWRSWIKHFLSDYVTIWFSWIEFCLDERLCEGNWAIENKSLCLGKKREAKENVSI